ncbi:MAG: hypothetical protein ACQESK_00770 [Bacteroidota bacterium]
MKYKLLIFFLAFSLFTFAQEEFTQASKEALEMQYEEKGKLSLLVSNITSERRFFLEKGNKIEELTEENYQNQLNAFTMDMDLNTFEVDFNLRDLARFVNKYNKGGEDNLSKGTGIKARLGIWGGVSNFQEFNNPINEKLPHFGAEIEVYSETSYSRNSLIFQARTNIANDAYDLENRELMLGYRFKIIDTHHFHFYAESELITFSHYSETYFDEAENQEKNYSGYSLDTPIGLGAGMALRLFKETFLTLNYSNIIRLSNTSTQDFPVDLRFGIKFKL